MPRFDRIISRSFATVFVVVLSMTVPASTQANAVNQPSNIKIKNFGRINDYYYRGSQPEIHDFADLAALGIRTVIDLTHGDGDSNEKAKVEQVGMKYCQIPMTTHERPTTEKIAEFLRIVNDPAGQPVYVHCVGGKHRTGVMTAIYRMTQNRWTAGQAFQEIKQFRFGMDFLHPEFKSFVFDYYSHLDRTPPPTVPEQMKTTGAAAAANP